MDIFIGGAAFAVAALCALTMGFAIQRGATCTVAAVDELFAQRRASRLLALLEASLWVSGGLLIAQRLGWLAHPPAGHPLGGWTVAGAALLGLGAFVNRACVFGAIARLGSGEWAYVATPLGFYLGCLSVGTLFSPPQGPSPGSVVLGASAPVALLLSWAVAGWFAFRVVPPLLRHRRGLRALLTQHLWSPHAATGVIGIAFVVMLLLVGAWAYTDALAELAAGMARSLTARWLLALCLLAGALLGGWTAGRFRPTAPRPAALLRCVTGGVLMGWGSLLIPGSNDGLILIGMPLGWPYAWVAFATMCLVIATAMAVQRRFTQRPAV